METTKIEILHVHLVNEILMSCTQTNQLKLKLLSGGQGMVLFIYLTKAIIKRKTCLDIR